MIFHCPSEPWEFQGSPSAAMAVAEVALGDGDLGLLPPLQAQQFRLDLFCNLAADSVF